MCQLTLIDTDPSTYISKSFIESLLEINTIGIGASPNRDGFGYMLFDDQEVHKSSSDAVKWFSQNHKEFFKCKDANGIYHVRLASTGARVTIPEKDAHPHTSGNLVLAHNGTLNFKSYLEKAKDIDKKFDTGMIDSEKFCIALSTICGDSPVTLESFNNTMDLFTGVYAMLFYDRRIKDSVFIVRGNGKKLHKLTIADSKDNPVGIVINTGAWELVHWGKMVKRAIQELHGIELTMRISEVPERKLFKYTVGSYIIGEDLGEAVEAKGPVVINTTHTSAYNSHVHDSNWTPSMNNTTACVYQKIAAAVIRLGFSYRELCVISEMEFGKNLLLLDADDIDILLLILDSFNEKELDIEAKYLLWIKLAHTIYKSAFAAYTECNLQFPFFMNDLVDLKAALVTADMKGVKQNAEG